jgi:hypothetical protein
MGLRPISYNKSPVPRAGGIENPVLKENCFPTRIDQGTDRSPLLTTLPLVPAVLIPSIRFM